MLLILLLAISCRARERVLHLTPNTVMDAALKGGESHWYRINLPPGQFADLVVEQRGIDVKLQLYRPDGRPFSQVDSPNGTQGPEPLPLLGATGPLRLEVYSDDQKAAAGRYAVRIGAVRPATGRDRARVAAERDFAAAKELQERGGSASLRAVAAKLEQTISQFEILGNLGRAADASYALGRVRIKLNEPAAAVPALQKSLAAFRASGDRNAEGRTINSLCPAYLSMGLPREALACDYNALAFALGSPSGEANALNNLGRAQESLGRAEEALVSYDQALILWRRLGLRSKEGLTLSNRGNLLGALGQTQRALDDLDRTLSLLEENSKAGALEIRGYLRSQAGQPGPAAKDLARALDLHRRAGDRRGEAVALNDLGLLYQSLDRKKARRAFDEAAAIFRELGDRSNEAVVSVNRGRLRAGDGDLSGAEADFEWARKAFVAAGQPLNEAMALLGLAKVQRERGDLLGALRTVETSLARIEALRTQPGSLALRTSFFASYQDPFGFAVDTAMELHGREPRGGYDAKALETAERARARTLLDALAQAGANPWQRVDPALQAREAAAREGLEAAYQRRQALVGSGASATQLEAAERDLRQHLGELERLEAAISHSAPPDATFQPLSLEAIRKATLAPDTLLLEYALGERRSFLWVVSSRDLHSYELPRKADLEEAAQKAHGLLADRRRTLVRREVEPALARLSRLLLGPAVSQLDRHCLVVVPDGALHLIPFGALPDPAAEGVPLLTHHEIVSVPSASSLAALRLEAAARKPAPALVAVLADPVFESTDPRVASRRPRPAPSAPGRSRRFPRLRFSREEARDLLSLAPPGERLLALDFAASHELATSGALGRFRILHFATHAIVDTEQPELSGIVLSMVDELGRPRDGLLRTYQIYQLHLPADLAVLSACETALGKNIRGEGVVGLTRAFFHAGARRVMVSLWPVEDRATADLMHRFYEGLFRRGRTPAEALRQAQDDMRRQPNRQDPHFWGGFVLQGDWR
ncbi:MAG TPA: CHAT domain-containing tetratricopeptide repeat protein [Thermoanaerobaculia bacterium]|nr:CHAT domain-containing tetratricopeptide repeat protein [Thermoanaerobaculia bacterium]